MQNLQTHVTRFKPGADLKAAIEAIVHKRKIAAGWIVGCVGSLKNYRIRMANQPEGSTGTGYFEIVSLAGTLSENGSHIHISIADHTGKTIGGHLLDGCIIYTTAELIIQSTDSMVFKREDDGSTGWKELQIECIIDNV